tara:strand:- start:4683 stop:5687 length:1005 start_codon:yes stop_codon:yes gene_type:complete
MHFSNTQKPLLSVQHLTTSFYTRNGIVRAVQDVSFNLKEGEILGIVGESGSGKSVTCYSLLGLLPQPPAKIESGRALLGDVDLLKASRKQLRSIRGKRISMVFQDPMTSLNPFLKVGTQLAEALQEHASIRTREAHKRAIEALEEVGIQDAAKRVEDYPHQFSGGMRQRVMIAMALITRPEVLIADEPTTALDVTVQAQILDILQKRRAELGTSIIFITHDLGVVSGFCDRVHVMYAGKTLESAPTRKLFEQSKHPYTQALQSSIPALHDKETALYTIPGSPPDLSNPPRGCPFAPRCEHAIPACSSDETPMELKPIGEEHFSACIRYQQGDLS